VRVFLAGATGAIGRQLVPRLISAGHEVTGTTRSSQRAAELEASGANAVVLDALDRGAVHDAVAAAAPDAVIHQLTALPQRIDPRKVERDFVLNDRLRSEGTEILITAAQAAGASRIIAQSISFFYAPGPPGTLHSESDPLLTAEQASASMKRSTAAVETLERTVLGAGGLILRYGYFYGPGTAIAADGSMGQDLAKRRMPVVGGGTGVWSLIHIADAAEATVAALDHGESRAYNIVDDNPAKVSEWLPALAGAIGAPKPMRVPAWLARPLAGEYGVATMTSAQGASNARAKTELGWTPTHPDWREGFRTALD
jgi:nucleoside-diphosphate-sugar epimerase